MTGDERRPFDRSRVEPYRPERHGVFGEPVRPSWLPLYHGARLAAGRRIGQAAVDRGYSILDARAIAYCYVENTPTLREGDVEC